MDASNAAPPQKQTGVQLKQVTFIGGPWDKLVETMRYPVQRLRVAVYGRYPADVFDRKADAFDRKEADVFEYTLYHVAGNAIYVGEGLDIEGAILRLLMVYTAKERQCRT